ncbi:MAG TPA: DNA/RNA nuclease SfsA [Rhodocyclaceae bacterium]
MRLPALVPGRLLGRRQRFLADVLLDSGEQVVAHCANTGSMLGCKAEGSRVWLSPADNPQRKLAWTWELVEALPGVLVGIHTGRSNALVEEAIIAGLVPSLSGFARIRREVRYGKENSRIDLLLENDAGPRCYVEVKNVTAAVDGGIALFPDAVSERGSKHLRELMAMVRGGDRAAIVFCCQRGDVSEVRPADSIDPVYGRTLRQAIAAGVEAYALTAEVSPDEIRLTHPVPVCCP